MSATSPRRRVWLSIAILAMSLGGCAHHPKTAPLKVTAIPADIPAPRPHAAEDRLYAEAARAITARDYGRALERLQQARVGRPDDPRVLTALGVIYDKLGRFDVSARYYDLAEKADPGSPVVAIDRRYSLMLRDRARARLKLVQPSTARPG
jgi:Flp pilus assembly protein TadD